MSDENPVGPEGAADPPAAPGRRDPAVLAAVSIAVLEGVALAAYAASIAVAALREPGSVASAPVVVVIFLIFAAGVLACGRGLWLRRSAARTPFGVVQLFGLVTGWTLTSGDGDTTHVLGYVVLAVSVVGIALVLSPALARELDT